MTKKAILQLEALTCPSCMQKIEHAVAHVDGVSSVKVMFNASKVKAEFDDSKTSAQDLAEVVTKLGYTVDKVKEKELAQEA
ncbi:heavy-metal-associated domain-containing protein [Paucilactobacillus nenjiangensis]|jgi:copper ion binding protein|uniref:Heavy-metal-associated domain-containing protein n=1 Tax=Paucilactobacillus nenjiangensis TaxID=1296540 RepID=A0A5P1X2G5_9LACO|nr:heavy-metal-associated domain-containing protein [Paucilactobacillus nenjiangensis]QER67074.1 heavy-metal-associated domain-containing protein [Paucilactobacillus nenjiangensis]